MEEGFLLTVAASLGTWSSLSGEKKGVEGFELESRRGSKIAVREPAEFELNVGTASPDNDDDDGGWAAMGSGREEEDEEEGGR